MEEKILTEDYFNLDACLEEFIKDLRTYQNKELTDIMVSQQNFLAAQPKSYLKHLKKKLKVLKVKLEQNFHKLLSFQVGGVDGYAYQTWDIYSLKSLIRKFDILPIPYPAKILLEESLNNGVDIENINNAYNVSNEPIILASHPVAQNRINGIIVDGNHRVARNYKNGISQTLTYSLKPEIHLKGMLTDIDSQLFKINYNIFLIQDMFAKLDERANNKQKKEILSYLPSMLYRFE